jgi:hypothetical protein
VRASHVAAVEEVTARYHSVIPRIVSLPELEKDVDGLGALERIAKNL